jgi:hypothetical protein
MEAQAQELIQKNAIELLKADHHEIRELFKEYEGAGEKAYKTKKFLAETVCSAITIHTILEEEIFYREIDLLSKDAQYLVDVALAEHTIAKALIAEIQVMSPVDDMYDVKMHELSEQIDLHVKEEEGVMFPLVGEMKVDLERLGEAMYYRKQIMENNGILFDMEGW